jgi:hypothetical protein
MYCVFPSTTQYHHPAHRYTTHTMHRHTRLFLSSSSLLRRSLYSVFFTHSSVRLCPLEAMRAAVAVKTVFM